MGKEKFVQRLEAWDAESAEDGWVVAVDDLRDWLEAALKSEDPLGKIRRFVEALK